MHIFGVCNVRKSAFICGKLQEKLAAEEKNIEFDVENIKDYNVSIHDSGVFTLVNYTSEKGDVESVKWSVSVKIL